MFGVDPDRIGLLGKPPAVEHSFRYETLFVKILQYSLKTLVLNKLFLWSDVTLIKKKIKFSSYISQFKKEQLQSHI